MNKLKVCFVGIGSIAKRHIKNLRAICDEQGRNLQVDAFRRNCVPVDGVNIIYNEIDNVPDDYDAIFITNPTEMHLESLIQFHDKGKHFFIEKPVVSLKQIIAAKKFQTRDGSIYYVAEPLRYNAVIQWVKNNINKEDVISVRSISSSYLPNWRPGKDYKETYSARRSLGGGVSIDLIHEWDYLTYLFGWPKNIYTFIGKKSDLEIDSDDYAAYIADYDNMVVELHLDYFGKQTIREILLITKNETIIGDIAKNKIRFLQDDNIYDFHEERDDYQKRELLHFLKLIDGKEVEEEGYRHGIRVLELTQGVIQ